MDLWNVLKGDNKMLNWLTCWLRLKVVFRLYYGRGKVLFWSHHDVPATSLGVHEITLWGRYRATSRRRYRNVPATFPRRLCASWALRRNSEVNKITLNKDKAIKVKVNNEMTSIEATVVPSNYHDSVTDWPSGECVTVWWSYINVVDIVIEDDWMAVSTYGECAWYHHKIFVSIMMTTLWLVRLNLYNCRWNVNHACKPKHDLNSPPLRPLSVNNSSPLSGQWVCNKIFTT